jgi:hypothetical protein
VAQVWIALRADDAEAVSALAVARRTLAAGRALATLRRFRLFELRGRLPASATLAGLMQRTRQFINPHREDCVVRTAAGEAAPIAAGCATVLVWERGGERRPAAERWWSHVTGERVEVREGVAWELLFEPGVDPAAAAADLATLRNRAHGLLCNPNAQEQRLASADVPLPWLTPPRRPRPA